MPIDRLGMVRSIVTYMLLQFPRTRERGGGEGERKKKREKKKRAPLRKRRMLIAFPVHQNALHFGVMVQGVLCTHSKQIGTQSRHATVNFVADYAAGTRWF